MSVSSVDELLGKLDSVKQAPNGGWQARCPAHADKHSHLSITQDGDKILLHCFIGCTTEAIVESIGFKIGDLFLKANSGNGRKVVSETPWPIRDANGVILCEHVRFDYSDGAKSFVWRKDGKDGLGGTKTADLPLYGLDHLMKAPSDSPVIIVEGEKAADSLMKRGIVAVGTVTGAAGCPSVDNLAPLIGFTGPLYLWPDNDEPGRKHMDRVAERLVTMGKHPLVISWAEAPKAGDAADFIGDVKELLGRAKPWESMSPILCNNVHTCNDRTGQTSSEAKRDRNGTEIGTLPHQNEAGALSRFEGLSQRVTAWVKDTSGWWATQELDADLGITGTQAKENRKKILQRLREQGLVEPHPKINKQWRCVNKRVASLEFKTAGTAGVLPVKWPMGIERYVNLFPGNTVVVAGSPNAGKTALLLDFIRLNMEGFPVYYFCSEMGSVELRNRLDQFPGMSIEDWHFKALERASDFADVIVPDCINLVDYLEMTDELYRVNSHLTAISHKIGTGLAIVALQKKQGAQYGRGQEFGLEKPKLYLSMDRGKLQIVKGKSWAKKNVDPHGLEVSFKIIGGCQFHVSQDWDWAK
jgi:hypothetical protein